MSGRRSRLFSTTVNWLTANQSLLAGWSKSMTRAWSPRTAPSGITIFHRHAVHGHAVERAVAGRQRRALWAAQLAEGVVQRIRRQVGVQAGEGVAKAPRQDDVAVVGALGVRRAGGDVGTVDGAPAQVVQPGQGRGFNGRFGDTDHVVGGNFLFLQTRHIFIGNNVHKKRIQQAAAHARGRPQLELNAQSAAAYRPYCKLMSVKHLAS